MDHATNFTVEQRRGIYKAFEAAKKHLHPTERNCFGFGPSGYICLALGYTKLPSFPMAQKIVHYRLRIQGRDHTAYTYLRDMVQVPVPLLTDRNVQEFRHRWLDSLIEEFKVEEPLP